MNKKRTTSKPTAREITKTLNNRSKYYSLSIIVSVLLLILAVVMTVNQSGNVAELGTLPIMASTMTLISTIIFLILVPSFGQHVITTYLNKQSRTAAAREPEAYVLARWTAVVLSLTLVLNTIDLWDNINSLAVSYVGFLNVVGIALVAALFAVVMAIRQYDSAWKMPIGLAFTFIATLVAVTQLFVIVHISLI